MALLKIQFFVCFVFLSSIASMPRQVAAQGLFSQMKKDIRSQSVSNETTKKKEKNRSSESYDDTYSNQDCDNPFSELFGVVILSTVTAPLSIPILAAEDDYESAGYFPGYPYQDDLSGYIMVDRLSQHESIGSEPYPYSTQSSTDYTHYSDEISKIGTRFLIDTTSRFGIDSEFSYWEESLPGGLRENFWSGDTNVLFRFAQTESVQMRTGIGFNWLSDDIGSDFGFNFTYKGDFFPIDPVIISAELDLGKIGSAALTHIRITTGVNWRHAEIFVGYDHLRLGETELDGLIGGLRIWF